RYMSPEKASRRPRNGHFSRKNRARTPAKAMRRLHSFRQAYLVGLAAAVRQTRGAQPGIVQFEFAVADALRPGKFAEARDRGIDRHRAVAVEWRILFAAVEIKTVALRVADDLFEGDDAEHVSHGFVVEVEIVVVVHFL